MNVTDLAAWDLFVAVAERGSFTAAARARGVPVATVSRAVAALEARLGAPLLHRTSRRLSLSPLGEEALAQARALLTEARCLEERLSDQATTAGGRIRLAAPLEFGQRHVAPLLSSFLQQYPDIGIDLDLDDRTVDLVGSGHDLALRIGHLADSSLIARRLCPVERFVVAAPAYLARHGRPAVPADLVRHRCLVYANSERPGLWRFAGADGDDIAIDVEGPLAVNSGATIETALVAGLGIAMLPDFLVAASIASSAVEALLPGWRTPTLGLYLLTPPGRHRPKRVQLLMEHLAAALGRPSWRRAALRAAPEG